MRNRAIGALLAASVTLLMAGCAEGRSVAPSPADAAWTPVTWGEYRIHGTWDGDVFTLDRLPVAAPLTAVTHDPSAPPPSAEPDPACASSEARLPTLRDAVPDIVSVLIDLSDGCVVVGVEYDDGTLQAAVDEHFGAGAFVIGSSFEPASEE